MRARSRWAPTPMGVEETSHSVSEFTFHLGLCPPDDIRPGHDHQVETLLLGTLETTKTFLEKPAGSVAGDGISNLPTHGEPETVLRPIVRKGEDHEEPSAEAATLPEDTIELRAGTQALFARESHDPSGPCTVRPPASFDPFGAGASRPGGPPSSACGPGSRASDAASDCWAETSSSCCSPSVLAIPRRSAHQDKLKIVAEEGAFCQKPAFPTPCTRARLYASLTGLQTANT
jgi:hypothetical protein